MKSFFMSCLTLALLTGATTAEDKKKEHSAEEKAAAEKIKKAGGLAIELAQNDPRWVVSFLSVDGKITKEHLQWLTTLKDVVHLNLRGRKSVNDETLAAIKGMTSLTKLHLEKTSVTDKGIEHLKGMTNLEFLNLYGNSGITDKALETLAGLKNLKKLFLWQTKVTDAGVAKLKKALPKLYVNRGFVIAKPKPTPAKDKKPTPAKDKKPKKK